ncbi:MAG: permease [Alphaproteobacteria bacterium]|nr:permease [Alphaproteobacteria bacterium]MCB9930793.1 permease [Alphaproteobacteria bacterium]
MTASDLPPAKPPAKPNRRGPAIFALSLMTVSGGLCWYLYGFDTVLRILTEDWGLMVTAVPRMALGVFIYGFLTVLVPRDWVAKHMGRDAGLKGIAIGLVAGALAPGGPWVIYPIAAMLIRFGAEVGAVVTFIMSWSVLGMNRFLVWEVSFLGEHLASMRLLAALPLPIVAGLLVRWLWPERVWPRIDRT